MWSCKLPSGDKYKESCTISEAGVHLKFESDAELCCRLPVFVWDGANRSSVEVSQNKIAVSFDGWTCCYETDGTIQNSELQYANRNGHYQAYAAKKARELNIWISIQKK